MNWKRKVLLVIVKEGKSIKGNVKLTKFLDLRMLKEFNILVIWIKILKKRKFFLKLARPTLTSIYKKGQLLKFYTYTKMCYKADTSQESVKENKALIII